MVVPTTEWVPGVEAIVQILSVTDKSFRVLSATAPKTSMERSLQKYLDTGILPELETLHYDEKESYGLPTEIIPIHFDQQNFLIHLDQHFLHFETGSWSAKLAPSICHSVPDAMF